MKENSIEELKQRLEELYRTQQARLDVGADDLDIREEIAEVEEEIKDLQDEINIDRENSIKNEQSSIEEDINRCNKLTASWIGLSNQLALKRVLSDYKRVLKENEELLELKVSASAHNRILELEKENKELQKEIDQMKSLDIYKLVEDWETGQFIPVQKVKDKIEELKKKVEELTDDKGYWGGSDLLEQIKALQELIESEK